MRQLIEIVDFLSMYVLPLISVGSLGYLVSRLCMGTVRVSTTVLEKRVFIVDASVWHRNQGEQRDQWEWEMEQVRCEE